jgi:hypothetical protein
MLEFQILLVEALLILGIFIFIFVYSAISAELLTSIITLIIFLMLLIPFYLICEKLNIILYTSNLDNLRFFNFFFFYSTIIIIFIAVNLVVKSFYLFAIS